MAASSLLQPLYLSAGWMFGCGAGVWCLAVMPGRLGRVIEDGGLLATVLPVSSRRRKGMVVGSCKGRLENTLQPVWSFCMLFYFREALQ